MVVLCNEMGIKQNAGVEAREAEVSLGHPGTKEQEAGIED